jgi:hypothetical protein
MLAEQDRIMALAFEAFSEKYGINTETWDLDRPTFAIKGIDNRITSFSVRNATEDRVVFIYGTALDFGGGNLPYYAIYHVGAGRIIDAVMQWVE